MIAHRKLCLQLGFIKARESLPGVSRLEMGRRQQVFHSWLILKQISSLKVFHSWLILKQISSQKVLHSWLIQKRKTVSNNFHSWLVPNAPKKNSHTGWNVFTQFFNVHKNLHGKSFTNMIFVEKLGWDLIRRDIESLETPREVVFKLQPHGEHLARSHRFVRLKVHLLALTQLQQPRHLQLLVDRLAGDVDVLDVEDDEVGLLGDLEDELDDSLDSEGGQVGAELQVVAHRTDEYWQPAEIFCGNCGEQTMALWSLVLPDIVPGEDFTICCYRWTNILLTIMISSILSTHYWWRLMHDGDDDLHSMDNENCLNINWLA